MEYLLLLSSTKSIMMLVWTQDEREPLMEKQDGIQGYILKNRSFRFLAGRSGKDRLRMLLILSAWIAGVLLANWIQGSLILEEGIGLLEDVVMLFLLIMLPALVFLTRPLITRFETLVSGLPEFVLAHSLASTGREQGEESVRASTFRRFSRSIRTYFLPTQESTSSLKDDMTMMRDYVSLKTPQARRLHRLLIAAAVALVVIFQILFPIFIPKETLSWSLLPHAYPLAFSACILWSGFWMIVVIRCVAWYPIAICLTLFPMLSSYSKKRRILVRPIAPDGKGGLSGIGKVSFSITALASCGLLLSVPWIVVFGTNLPLMIGFPAYLMLLTGLFFLPLLSVHEAMDSAKSQELEKWAKRFQLTYENIEPTSNTSCEFSTEAGQTSTHLHLQLQCMEAIEHVYARAESMPVWPFDLRTLKQFLTVVLVPLLILVIQLITEDSITIWIKRILP